MILVTGGTGLQWRWHATEQDEGEDEHKVGLLNSRLVTLVSATISRHQRQSLRAAECSEAATSSMCHFKQSCDRSRSPCRSRAVHRCKSQSSGALFVFCLPKRIAKASNRILHQLMIHTHASKVHCI